MKKLIFLLLAAVALIPAGAEKKKPRIFERYALQREMPLFLDSLQAALTYPLAWPNWKLRNPELRSLEMRSLGAAYLRDAETPTAESRTLQTPGVPEVRRSQATQLEAWRVEGRNTVMDCMGILPERAADMTPRLVAVEQRDGYQARKYEVQLTKWTSLPFLMLVPDNSTSNTQHSTFPAILLLHDHGGHYTIGKEKMIRPFATDSLALADADAWAAQCYGGQYVGDYLAKNGFVVAAADALMWGERGREEGQDGNMLGAICGNFGMLGASLAGMMTWEDMLMAEVLAAMPETKGETVGAMGFSMGAYRAWMLAAMSDVVDSFAAVCWMTTTKDQLSWEHGREKGGFINQLPNLRRYMDYPHIASLAAGKPAYFISGRTDKLFNPAGVTDAFAQMRQVWDSVECRMESVELAPQSENHSTLYTLHSTLRTELWDQGHDCGVVVQDSILQFFKRL